MPSIAGLSYLGRHKLTLGWWAGYGEGLKDGYDQRKAECVDEGHIAESDRRGLVDNAVPGEATITLVVPPAD